MSYSFLTTCVGLHRNEVPALHAMIGGAEDITRQQFMAEVDLDELDQIERDLGYGPYLRMENDYHVSYHRSAWKGKPCFYFRWSAIEHIFTEES